MSERSRIAVLIACFVAIVVLSARVAVRAQAPAPANASKMSQDVFKNIQVLKDVPPDQFAQGMQFIAASLGVQCDHCHEQGAFEKDDKKPKQKAREMMKMMFAINANNFDGHRDVTCYSCHRGSLKPLTIPVISEKEETVVAAPEPPDPSKLPAASALVDKYVQALGGADAVQKVSTRVEKGTMSMLGRQFPIELFVKAPDKRISVVHAPSGDTFTAFDGHVGWLGAQGHPARDMVGAELDAVRLDADLYLPVRIKQIFSELKTDGSEKLGDRDVYVVVAKRLNRPPVKFYFDQQSGLLCRQVRYAESPLGQNPTQIDYADYRDEGGVKTPFRWTIARPSGRFTVQVEKAEAERSH